MKNYRLNLLLSAAAMTAFLAVPGINAETRQGQDGNSRGERHTLHTRQMENVQVAQQGRYGTVDQRYRRRSFFDFFKPRRRVERTNPVVSAPVSKPVYRAYKPDALYQVGDKTLTQPRPNGPLFGAQAPASYDPTPPEMQPRKLDDSLAQTIYETLKARASGATATKPQNKAIVEFYTTRGFKPVWTSMDGVEPNALGVLETFEAARFEGLDSADYTIAALEVKGGEVDAIADSLDEIARFELQLTTAALRYAMNASGGRIHPNRLSGYHDLKPPVVDAAKALTALASHDRPENYLASLHPVHPAYAAFKQALVESGVGDAQNVDELIGAGPFIRPGDSDPRVPQVRARLNKLGVYAEDQLEYDAGAVEVASLDESNLPMGSGEAREQEISDSPVYDDQLVAAVIAFQGQSGLTRDGIIGPATIGALNGQSGPRQVERLVHNMERLRWMPRRFGQRHVFVNQPAYQASVMEHGRSIWTTRVIVGKPENQTSFFSDKMELVVFNPYWGVPQSILSKEMLPKLQQDPSYLDDRGFEVYDRSGQQIMSRWVDWYNFQYGRKLPFSVRQKPGNSNALGRIKFMFPNKHAIYMHDTPTKPLFERSRRAFSHGCVRVQNPHEFAEILLGWNQTRIASYVESGKNTKIRLDKTVPVHLTYFTAWPDENGSMQVYDDIYGRDGRLSQAFALTAKMRR